MIAGCLRSKPGYTVSETWTDLDAVGARATDGAMDLDGEGWSATNS